MKVLYLGGPGPVNIRLTKDGIQIGDATPTPPPEFEYDTILVGNCKGFVSFPALKQLGKWGVSVGLMGQGGTALSTFVPWARNDAPLRLAQMRVAVDPALRVKAARAFVEAKVGKSAPKEIRSVDGLRYWEGKEAAPYWKALGINRISKFSYALNRRATNTVNAAINAAHGVECVRHRAIIAKIGLDPTVGFLHNALRDKEAFLYDSQELTRAVVDKAAIEWHRTAPESSFIRDDEWTYRLAGPAMRELALKVGAAMSREVPYSGMRCPVDGVLARELRKFGAWCEKPSQVLSLYTFPS